MTSFLFVVVFLIFQCVRSFSAIVVSFQNESCMKARMLANIKSTYRQTILCELGEVCILKSNCCSAKLPCSVAKWTRMTVNQPVANIINLNDPEGRFFREMNDLRIENVELTDNGLFTETLYETTVVREYHVTVLDEIAYFPIMNKTSILTDFREFNQKLDERYSSLRFYSKFKEANDCLCENNTAQKGYSFRDIDCFIGTKPISGSNLINSKLEKYVFNIVNLYSGKVHCESAILPLEFKLSIKDLKFKSYRLYNQCDCEIKPSKNNSLNATVQNLNKKDTLLYMPQSVLLLTEPGKSLTLRCRMKPNPTKNVIDSQMNINWRVKNREVASFSTSDRIYMDRKFRLRIKRIEYQDSTNYTCYLNNQIRTIYIVRVVDKMSERFVEYASYSGVCLFMSTLIAIVVVSARQPKIKL
jgi:hypothetical protein